MGLTEVHVFVRAPIPGRAKTRLARRIGDEAACDLYRAFVEDTVASLAERPALSLVLSATERHPFLEALAARSGARFELQVDGDLGVRMEAALATSLARGPRALVVGSDAPTLPPGLVLEAARALETSELVFAPAGDGGYVLVGAARVPRLAPVRWSTRHALADSWEANGHLVRRLLPPWYDVDEPDDLALLRAHLRLDPAAAPRTARALETLGRF